MKKEWKGKSRQALGTSPGPVHIPRTAASVLRLRMQGCNTAIMNKQVSFGSHHVRLRCSGCKRRPELRGHDPHQDLWRPKALVRCQPGIQLPHEDAKCIHIAFGRYVAVFNQLWRHVCDRACTMWPHVHGYVQPIHMGHTPSAELLQDCIDVAVVLQIQDTQSEQYLLLCSCVQLGGHLEHDNLFRTDVDWACLAAADVGIDLNDQATGTHLLESTETHLRTSASLSGSGHRHPGHPRSWPDQSLKP